VHEQLTRLEEKGYIRRDRLKARSIEILRMPRRVSSGRSPDDESVRIPLLGEIAAGLPLLSEANFDGQLEVPISRGLRPGNFFALRVKGDSMIECGIHPDDYVVVRQQTMAENGEIVAAMLDDGATVKRLKKSQLQVMLCPENPSYKPIDVTCREDFRVLGKVIHRLGRDAKIHGF
ncbi:transcriptional repressor LexA, partial [Myxococcota bacterium]|nr:transcriptional repressor LexA [Myxococcota bacterium]